MARDTVVAVVTRELELVGVRYEVEVSKRHPKVRYFHNGQRLTYCCPGSHSDHRSIMNNRCAIRRQLRALGLIS